MIGKRMVVSKVSTRVLGFLAVAAVGPAAIFTMTSTARAQDPPPAGSSTATASTTAAPAEPPASTSAAPAATTAPPPKATDTPTATAPASTENPEPKKDATAEPPKQTGGLVDLGIDFAYGRGDAPFAAIQNPGSLAAAPRYTLVDAPAAVMSFILSGGYAFSPNTRVGMRLPFSAVGFSPEGSRSRNPLPFGALEFNFSYRQHTSETSEVFAALALTLPTAQGDELPSRDVLEAQNGATLDQNAYDRFAGNRAASRARGYLEEELYREKRIGLTPRLAYRVISDKLLIEPFLKWVNLVATSSSIKDGYLGMLVPGIFGVYRVADHVELGMRAWANVAYAGSQDDKKVAISVEPLARFPLGSAIEHVEKFRPEIGVIVPIIGTPADPRFIAVRLGLGVSF